MLEIMALILRKLLVFLCALTVVQISTFVASLIYCHRGSYYLIPNRGTFVCPLCPPGTFMPFHDHKYTECFDCMKVEDDTLESLITPCNGTHDAVIHCDPGYYRRLPRNPREKERCEKCSVCGIYHEIIPCRTYEDVHCCAGENFDVLPNEDGVPVCMERQWLCRRGEYLNTNSFQCRPCPADTFMPLDYHSLTECFKCHSSSRDKLPKHGAIIQPCNKTQQAVVGCEEGYYINHHMGYEDKNIGCSPCKACKSSDGLYEGRKCGSVQDTVCCSKPNMTVVDTPSGTQCMELTVERTMPIPEPTACAKDEYLWNYEDDKDNSTAATNENKTPAACKLCPRGTFMDESKHNKTACKSCKDVTGDSRPPSCPSVENGNKHEDGNVTMIVYTCLDDKDVTGFVSGMIFLVVMVILIPVVTKVIARLRPHLILKLLGIRKDEGRENIPLLGTETGSMQGNCKMEVSSDDNKGEQTLSKRQCSKNPSHKTFILGRDFSINHLPENWRDALVFDFIKTVIALTVRVSVSYASENRPPGYPLYDRRGRGDLKAYGSGWVHNVCRRSRENVGKICPCESCIESSRLAKTQCWEFGVYTTCSVIFDSFEAEHAECDLFFDNGPNCPGLKGVEVMRSDIKKDSCDIRCITHDENVANELEKLIDRYEKLCHQLRERRMISQYNDRNGTAVIVSHPHGLDKYVTVGEVLFTPREKVDRWVYTAETCSGSSGAPVCLLGNWYLNLGCWCVTHSGYRQLGQNESTGIWV